jgi:NADH:ubiquinone oxidoreductase subunit 5 (subunit L)/multisubunit Na+/H+ antiporter MnhA subunit
MADSVHPAASHHLPGFITAPGETDVLMVVMSILLAIVVLAFGVLFLRLHTMPERIAHRGHKVQFEIVAVLGLIALFTHMHIFWVAGLLLALIDLPDFGKSLARIAGSTEKIAGMDSGENAAETSLESAPDRKQRHHAAAVPPDDAHNLDSPSPGLGREPKFARATRKELTHA